MSWHYQICKNADGVYGLHEVYHTPDGILWTEDAVRFYADADEGEEGIVKMLELALKDAKTRGVRDISNDEGGGDGANAAATTRRA